MAKCKNCNNLYNLSNENDEIVGKWCPKINYSPHVEMERECEYYKRMTQADRIRSFSDEELADYIFGVSFQEKPFVLCSDDCDFCELTDEECKNRTLAWLQSEVEE